MSAGSFFFRGDQRIKVATVRAMVEELEHLDLRGSSAFCAGSMIWKDSFACTTKGGRTQARPASLRASTVHAELSD